MGAITLAHVKDYGIVGAGGAGFPAYVKLDSKPDTVIMNAAECEPLVHKDMELILHFTDKVLLGLKWVMEITGADKAIIGIKAKHSRQIELLRSKITENTSIVELDDVYPAGDEVTLIYMTTGRVVRPGALPISAGCIVHNVETLYNIGNDKPVVEKFLTVGGAVASPATIKVPIGTTYADVLSHFKITASNYIVHSGGLMMGSLEEDLNTVVSKKTGALIVLPTDHYCVTVYRRFASDHAVDLIAKAGCDQCNFCTEFCPRYLLGYPVRPETAMRNRMFSREDSIAFHVGNLYCCECNLCTMYACPEGLDPRGAAIIDKRLARQMNEKWDGGDVTPHPMYEYRKVPTKILMQRLDVLNFKDEGPFTDVEIDPEQVRVPLDQHVGSAAKPIVKVGSTVKRYDLIAEASGRISSNVHASISGVVREVTDRYITIQRLK